MMSGRMYWNENASIGRLVRAFQRGDIAIGASDTVFGLFAPLSKEGKVLLDMVKQRSGKPYLILVGSKEKLLSLVDHGELLHIENIIRNCWPGPITLILRAKPDLPSWMKAENGTIAVRIPKHDGLQKLLKQLPGLFSTSANISGKPIPTSVDEVDERILASVATVVLDSDEKRESAPSTILDCTGGQIRLVREGAYSLEELEKIYGHPILRP